MASNEVYIGKYIFSAKDITLSMPIRIRNYLIATFGANDFYRRFCKKNGIDLPLRNDVHWSLPEEYNVEHVVIDRLGESRDRIISAFHEIYVQTQSDLEDATAAQKRRVESQEKYLELERAKLEQYISDRQKSKDAQELIFLDSKIKTQESLVSNQEFLLDEMEAELSRYESVEEINFENWNDQLKNIEDEITSETFKFIMRLGRKVKKKLSYSEFQYIKPEYSEKVHMIVQMSKPSIVHKAKVKKVK